MRFLASLFFRSTVIPLDAAEVKDSFWEEVIVFILASSQSEALQKANDIGKRKSGLTYSSEFGQVTWNFVQVERIVLLEDNDFKHADELFSRYLRASEATSILAKLD